MSISHCYCSDYMTKPTQFGDEPQIFVYGPANLSWMSPELKVKFQSKLMANDVKANITVVTNMMKRLPMTMRSL